MMAMAESKAAMLLNLGLILSVSLLLLNSMAEGKQVVQNCKTNYKVQSGDTCYAIWKKFNLTQEEFYIVNPNIVCEKLIVGQFLCVDGKAPTVPAKPPTLAPQGSPIPGPDKKKCKGVYEIQKGDTCNAIWQKFNLTQKKFELTNPGVVCGLLYIGQKICIGEKM